MLEYLCGKMFGSKISCINRKEVERVGTPPSTEQIVEGNDQQIQKPGNYPEKSIQHSEHGESLKPRTQITF